jgi:hypothetical protein
MRSVHWAAVVSPLVLCSCMSLEERLTEHLEGQQNISRICADPTMTQVSLRERYQTDLSELARLEFGLDLKSQSEKNKSVLEAVADVQDDFNDLYLVGNDKSRAEIDKVRADLKAVNATASALRDSIESKVKAALAKRPVSFKDALNDFEVLLTAVAPLIRSDVSALSTQLSQVLTHTEAALPVLKDDVNLIRSPAWKKIGPHLDKLKATLIAAMANFRSIIAGKLNASPEQRVEIANKLQVLVDDLITYEMARLVTLEVSRGARSIEYKLDQVDDKTWFVVSVLGFTMSDSVEKAMAERLRELLRVHEDNERFHGQPELRKDLRKALVVCACEQIATDHQAAPTNSVRAAILLQPFYQAIIVSLTNDEINNVGSANKMAVEKGEKLFAQPDAVLTPAQVGIVVNSLVTQVRRTDKAFFDYRQARIPKNDG